MVIGIAVTALGAYLVYYSNIEGGLFYSNVSADTAFLAVILLILGVATTGAAIDGIFSDRYYASMRMLSLRWRMPKERQSANDQADESDNVDESD